ncbi:LysR family transcriptional regulator [Pasteurellaceae bacterium LFhippo2]|nr:LysR family transcriptional regulator [Pasteurellaceae bacterium LFhippo2]
MNNHFSGIEEFLTVVETGSFSGAGERLNLTGSAVGKSISRLEQRLNTQLFHRSTRKLTLTKEGEVWLASCQRMMNELEQAQLLLSTERQEVIGKIRIDLPTTYGRNLILPKLLGLQKQYPKLQFELSFQDRKVDMIAEHIDVAVRFGQLADLDGIIAKQIDQFQNQFCASPDYLARFGTPTHPRDLQQHICITGGQSHWQLLNEQGQATLYPLNNVHQLNDGDARLQMVLADCGIALLPDWLIEKEIHAGRLVQILPEWTPPSEPIYVLWQKKLHLQPKVKAIVDVLGNSK